MFTTLSTILVPIKTGFTSSLPFVYPRLLVIPDLALLLAPLLETCPLEGEQAALFGAAFELVSGKDLCIVGGASVGGFFDGLDLTDGELPRDGAHAFTAEDNRPPFIDVLSTPDGFDGL